MLLFLLVPMLSFIVYVFILYKMFVGEKWGRTIYLILSLLSIIWEPIDHFFIMHDPIRKLYYPEALTSVIVLVLVFSKEAGEWYNRKKIPSGEIKE